MAIQKSRRIPQLNPVRFTPVNYTLPAGINTYPFDKGFAHQQIRTFYQDKKYYQQKFAGEDAICIYVDSLAASVNVKVIDRQGNEVHDFGAPATPFVTPSNLDPDFGLPYNTHPIKFKFTDASIPTGQYHILLEYLYGGGWGDAENTFDVSEPIYYDEDGWEDTMLVKYAHNYNEFDVMFVGAPIGDLFPFNFRAEMVLFDPEPASNDTVWEDQLYVIQQEQSIPYNTYELCVGGNGGVPQWVIDKMNAILSCSHVYIDNIRLRKNSGANWNLKKAEGCAFRAGNIVLREVDTTRNYVESNVEASDAVRFYTGFYTDFYT